MRDRADRGDCLTRRTWLAALGGVFAAQVVRAKDDDEPAATEESEISAISQQAIKAGIANLRTDRSEHYVAIGDAGSAFQADALDICEILYQDFQKHFESKGFKLAEPKRRLTVVALSGASSFEAFSGEDPRGVVGGYYELDDDRLIFFDFRSVEGAVAKPRAANLMSLAHEATHQLCYNRDLLRKGSDVPVAISEGLATYCEQRTPKRHTEPGRVNVERLKVLRPAGRAPAWIPVAAMLSDDSLFDPEAAREDRLQFAYAESWLLIHMLMHRAQRLEELRGYLKAIRRRAKPDHRLEDAEENFGDLKKLDRELKAYQPR